MRTLSGGLSAHYSAGARTRASQLQGFLGALHEVGAPVLHPQGEVALVVADAPDWRRLCRYPYGMPFVRNLPGGQGVLIFAAADFRPRFLGRFEPMLLGAAREGHRPPGHISEFVDLMLGHEWGHALANLSGLRTRVRWLDELIASYLFVVALRSHPRADLLGRLTDWSQLQVTGTAQHQGALGDFEYPRSRAGFEKLLWYQGVFTLRALELAPRRGWEFPLALREALPAAHRGELARSLVSVEPSFKPWFRVFGREPN